MAEITITQLTGGSLEGEGVFDVLMRATKAHLEAEFARNRIKGPEYATVYLGSLQAVMDRSLQFLLNQQKVNLEAQLLEKQILSEEKNQALLDAQIAKLNAEIALLGQQLLNLTAEGLNIPKQGLVLDGQVAKLAADVDLAEQQLLNLIAEGLNIPKQGLVLDGQKCKLDAEFDVLVEQKLKTVSETALLAQKKITEQAQTSGTGVDPDSVLGRQMALYQAQEEGYQRNAEQKAAKLLADVWSVKRTTDSTVPSTPVTGTDDVYITQAMTKLLQGINAA